MTREERWRKIDAFGRAPQALSAALRQFPKKMWLYKPQADAWSIHEIILHLADSEANGYIRCRRLIAEPGKQVLAYDHEAWAGALGYSHQSTKQALDLFRRMRMMTYQLLVAVPELVWANTVEHPEMGTISLEQWLEIHESQVPQRLEQMKRNYDIWFETHPPRRPATRRQKGAPPTGTRLISLNATL